MSKVIELFSALSALLNCYPAWVKTLFSLWLIFTTALLLALIFARTCPPAVVTERVEPPVSPSEGNRTPSHPQPVPTIIFPPIIVISGVPIEFRRIDVAAKDKNGKDLKVAVGVLWDPYRWVLNSTERVGISKSNSTPIAEILRGLPQGETRPIIAVGTASHENADDRPEVEEARAEVRADTLVDLCQRQYPNADIYSLNLGFFRKKGADSDSSATERRVILLVIESWEAGADLTSGVRDALIKAAAEQRFSFDASNYSNFPPERFRVVERRAKKEKSIEKEPRAEQRPQAG